MNELYNQSDNKMSINLDLSSSRTTRALDARSERAARFLPYLKTNKVVPVNFRVKSKRSAPKESTETHVRRYEQNQAITVLSIRFASSEQNTKRDKDEEMYIRQQQMNDIDQKDQQEQKERLLPYLKYRRYESPEEQLRNMGYDPDVRIAAEVYSDKIQERKIKYVNKMEALKRELQNCTADKRQHRMDKSRIQVKILGEEIRRKRQREILQNQQRRGSRLLQSLLNPNSQALSA